jgi:glycerophosphoryl diester phosphodiesterase
LRARTLEDIRNLDAGMGERVPLLREVIETIGRRALLNIELKGPRTAAPVADLLREFLARGWSPDDFLISSFRRGELKRLRDSGFRTGLLFGRSPRLFRRAARALGVWSIHAPIQHVTAGLVDRVHTDGLKLFVFTVNNHSDMERMERLGVDAIFTDYPDRWTGNTGLIQRLSET